MLKRPYILAILVIIFALSVLLAGANGDKQVRIQSKADQAKRLWSTSAHADKAAEAFKHWDEDGSIPTSCAKCHSTPGYKDYIGADGSAFNVVDKAAPLGTTVECEACHADPGRGSSITTRPSSFHRVSRSRTSVRKPSVWSAIRAALLRKPSTTRSLPRA